MNLFSARRAPESGIIERAVQREFRDTQIRTAMGIRSRLAAAELNLDYVEIPKKWPFGHKGLAKAWIFPIEENPISTSYAVTVDGKAGWTKKIKGDHLLIGSRFLRAPVDLSEVLVDRINSTGISVGEFIMASIDTGFYEVSVYPDMATHVNQTPVLVDTYPLSQVA